MRISKTLDGSVRFSLLYSFLLRCWIDFACLDLIRQNTWHTHIHICTPRSRAIADAWSLNNLLLFDRTLFAKLNGQTICSSSVKVPTSDYPSTDAHLFRLVFFSAAKWNPFPARDIGEKRKGGEKKIPRDDCWRWVWMNKRYARIFRSMYNNYRYDDLVTLHWHNSRWMNFYRRTSRFNLIS